MIEGIVNKPPRIAMILLGTALAAHLFIPGPILIEQPYSYAGYVLVTIGTLVMFWAWGLFKNVKTPLLPTDKPVVFVSTGPYRVTRNPMYLGMVVILFGSAVAMATIPGFIAVATFFMIINFRFIPIEERSMVSTFGQQYQDYKLRIRRWL